MSDFIDKAKKKANEIENKAHELKGRIKQKKQDMEESEE